MRRVTISAVVAVAMLAALPAAAQASFHLVKANEVMLASSTGDPAVQFVELFDPSPEPFPLVLGPYKLVVYDAGGHRLGGQELSASGLASASGNRPYLISTTAANAAFPTEVGDETLTIPLPRTAGQACYTAGSSEAAYSCITWGCISHAISTSGQGSFHGAVPGNGKSAQRQDNDSIQIGNPTPKTTNVAGTSGAACPGGGGGSQFSGVQIPKQTDTVKKGKAPVTVKCPAKATDSCVGKLTLKTAKAVKDSNGKKHVVTLGSASFTIAAGKSKTVKVGLSKQGKFVLAHHKSIDVNATAKAHDGSTTKNKTTTRKITLKQPPKTK